ncbi:hypothetical protein BDQ12DRAFT_74082 [Crucibulum laeve]|uniref:F-box domain-containing protein n=1 Tax=Crucibulum laeve TaxID=68775 RepID=A0A5C3M1C2_9AGAR|nr:hypothetical protein BDQ12DRAFT_74082 [Crucibulum laeve]
METTMDALKKDELSVIPIPPLPIELFLAFFVAVIESTYPDMGKSKARELNARTVRHASQVCRYWRETLLNYPAIWGQVICLHLGSLRWYEELLHRSKISPIDLIEDEVIYEGQYLTSVLQHYSRIRILDLSIWEDVLIANPQLIDLCGELPLLQEFRLIGTTHLFSFWQPTDKCVASIGIAPALYKLSQCFLQFDIRTAAIQNITHLELEQTMLLPLSQYLTVLQNTKKLQVLSIIDSFHPLGPQHGSLPRVSLPCLYAITLEGCLSSCVELLSHLETHPELSLSLTCERVNYHLRSISSTSNYIHNLILHWSPDNFQPFLETKSRSNTLRIYNTGQLNPKKFPGSQGDQLLQLKLTWEPLDMISSQRDIVSPMLNALAIQPMENLQILAMNFASKLSPQLFKITKCFLSMCSSVQELAQVTTWGSDELMLILEQEPHSPRVLLPSLQKISLGQSNKRDAYKYSRLREFMTRRCICLDITFWSYKQELVEYMKAMIPNLNIVWDPNHPSSRFY